MPHFCGSIIHDEPVVPLTRFGVLRTMEGSSHFAFPAQIQDSGDRMRSRLRRSIPLVALCLLGAASLNTPVEGAEPTLTKLTEVEGITEYKLPNGLRVLLFPDDSKPVVTVNLTMFVGSRHEGYGETGMAHLLEHMLFKGTPEHPDVPKVLRDHGARFNGTTWVDRTNYYETMPASDENLEFALKLEADRMLNSNVKREDLLSEMTVVRNEFESGENDPSSILSQRVLATAYEWHNYGKSTIGNRSDIERVPVDNLKAFYKKYYRPDNAMLAVAGKFDEAKAKEYILKYFGSLKNPSTPMPNTYTEEPAQDGERFVSLRRVGSIGAVCVAYHIPAAAHPDFAAVQILEDTLTSSPSGRLYKALVETKKATSLTGTAYAWHDPSVMEMTAACEPSKVGEVRTAMLETLDSLTKNPITEEEVERSKRRFIKFNEQLMAKSDQLAISLSNWAGSGDWRLFFLHRDRMEAVTAEDVNRVAREYLKQSNRTVGVFEPTEKPDRAEIAAAPSPAKLLEGYEGKAGVAQGETFDPSPANIEKRLERGTLSEALKYGLLTKKSRGELVYLQLTLHFGNEKSLQGFVTPAELLGAMLRRGTAKHTRQELQDELDKLQAQVGLSSDVGELEITIQVKRPNLEKTLALVREMLREPTFPEDEFEILRREQVQNWKEQSTQPQGRAIVRLRRLMSSYPKDDVRYVPTIEEKLAEVEAVTVADVKKLYEEQLGGAHGELAAVGDFDADFVKRTISGMLEGWSNGVPYRRIPNDGKFREEGATEVILTPDKANAVYLGGIAFPMKDTDPDYPALMVGNYLLGGAPLASRLSKRVRGEEGLSYGVGSFANVSSLDERGSFMIFAITNPANINKVDAAIGEEVAKFLKDGVSLVELDEGKKAYLQSLKVGRSDDSSLVGQIAKNLNAGRTFEYNAKVEEGVENLGMDQVRDVFRKFIDPKKLVIIEAGDFKKE